MEKLEFNELTYEQFVDYVRSALHYLYDPVHLRNSPLGQLLGLMQEFDRAAALQQRLSAAIRNLKPEAEEPPQSRAWRIYDTLHFLYIRQLERSAVALQLGISERQLRREQRVALEQLAQALWKQMEQAQPAPAENRSTQSSLPSAETNPALSQELTWLKHSAGEQRVQLGEAMHTVQTLAQPLAQQWQVTLQVDVEHDLAQMVVSALALRSILLTILSVAIPRAGQGAVRIAARLAHNEVECVVSCVDASQNLLPLSEKECAILQTAKELASFYSARLLIPVAFEQGFSATLTLRSAEPIPILVIDDNTDWLELLQRYAANSPYQVIGTPEPEQAQQLAEQVQPKLIFLDVMMHNMDGWQVLSALRNDPATERLPIVICTILPVEELALSLGANSFLQKPVTQQQFLKTISDWQLWDEEPMQA